MADTTGTRWEQLKTASRKGNGTQGQSFGGGATSDRDITIYDAGGNVIASDISINDVLVGSGGPGSPYQEVPIGVKDGSNTTFHTTFIPVGADASGRVPVWLFIRGVKQNPYKDFTFEAGTNAFTMTDAPVDSDDWFIIYIRGAAGTPPPTVPAIESAELSVWTSHTASGSSSVGGFVQPASNIANSGPVVSTTTKSITAAFASPNTAGNTIIVWVWLAQFGSGVANGSPSLIDSLGNTYTRALAAPPGGNANGAGCWLYYASAILAGANTLTFSFDAIPGATSAFEYSITAAEYSAMPSPTVHATAYVPIAGTSGNSPTVLTLTDSLGVPVSVTFKTAGAPGSNGIGSISTGAAIADFLSGGVNYIVAAAMGNNNVLIAPTTSPTGYQGFTREHLASDVTNASYAYYWDPGTLSVSHSIARLNFVNAGSQSSVIASNPALFGLTQLTSTLPIPTRGSGVNSYAGSRVEFSLESNGSSSASADELDVYDVSIAVRFRDGSTQTIRPDSYRFWSGSQGGTYNWEADTFYAAGVIVIDANGNLQRSGGGTSGDDPGPTWAASGITTDGTITWTYVSAQTSTTGQIADPALAFDADSGPPITFAALTRSHFGSLSTGGLFTVLFSGGATVNPTIGITSPISTDGVTGLITLSANAIAVSPATMVSVEFKVDGVTVATVTGTGPNFFTLWDSSGASPGSHTITAIATDSLGQTTTTITTVTVSSDTLAPGVTFIAPLEGGTYSGTIALSVSATAVLPAGGLGLMNDDTEVGSGTDRANDLAAMTSLGVTIARNNIDWGGTEPSPGSYNWTVIDAAINDLVGAGITPLIVLYGSPAWANGNSDHFVIPSGTGSTFLAWVNAYAAWATVVVNRFKDRVKHWELWNEENDKYLWKPAANSAQYILWFNAVNAAVKAADPSCHTLLGGMSGLTNVGPDGIQGQIFLQDLYDAGVFPEIVAIHPYSGDLSPDDTTPFTNQYHDTEIIRSIMVANGQSDKPIWITEINWLSDNVGETLQATYLTRAIEIARTDWAAYVQAIIVFALRAIPGVGSWAIIRNDWSFKPAGTAFQSAAAPPTTTVSVEFKVDGVHLDTETGAGPIYSTTLDTTTLTDADHTITAIATDSASATHSAEVTITVNNSGGGGSVDTSHDFTTALSDESLSLLHDYEFGTGGNVTSLAAAAALFDNYLWWQSQGQPIGSEWQKYQPFNETNFVLTAGSLDLTATIYPGGGLFPGGIYSGQIVTKEQFQPGVTGHAIYAFEVRMKVPGTKGSWPAGWLFAPDRDGGDGSEIDHPEFFNYTGGAYNWTGYNHGPHVGDDFYSILTSPPDSWRPGTDFSAGEHSFQTIWTGDKVYRYVDGLLVRGTNFVWSAAQPAQWIIDLAVGSSDPNLAGLQPNSLADFPIVLSIAHMKVWGL